VCQCTAKSGRLITVHICTVALSTQEDVCKHSRYKYLVIQLFVHWFILSLIAI